MKSISHFFQPVNHTTAKANQKSVSPLQQRVDPKKTVLKKKSDTNQLQEVTQQQQNSNKKKDNKKDEILDTKPKKQMNTTNEINIRSNLSDKERGSTPKRQSEKYASEMEIEEQENFGLKVATKNSLLKQNKKQAPVKVTQMEEDNEDIIEVQHAKVGLKKKKLTKLSEKQEKKKANVRPTKQQKTLMIVDSNEESSEDISQSDEDSVKGDVEFVDDEVDNLQKNKKIDSMFQQNKLKFKEQKKPEQQQDKKPQLQDFLHNNTPSKSTSILSKNLEQITLDDSIQQVDQEEELEEDGYNSDEEKLRQIEQLQQQQKFTKFVAKSPIIISDTPIKQQVQEMNENENNIEEEHSDENKIHNIESTEDLQITPSAFENMKFYFLGSSKEYENDLLQEIIKKNKGQVMSHPIKPSQGQQQIYNVKGTYNVNKNKEELLIGRSYPLIKESELITVIENTLQSSIHQIAEQYSKQKSMESSSNKTDSISNNINNSSSKPPQIPNLAQNTEKSVQQIPAKMTQSINQIPAQKIQAQQQKIKPKQEENRSMSSLLSSFLPQPIQQSNQENEDLDQSLETAKKLNITQSENVSSKPNKLFTKEKLSKPVKAITMINEDENLVIRDNKIYKNTEMEIEFEKKPAVKPAQKEQKPNIIKPIEKKDETNSLWTHKYSPKELKDCVGNESVIKKLENWLVNWENVVIHKQKAQGNWKENPNARACLISGPPGIGKTSTVRLLAQKFNMNIIEWNASDVRSKNALETIVNPLKDNQVLNFSFTASSQRSIILMDEVDGMSSGDIGGNQALIKIIKESKNPIFCVCNDRYSQKLRSLSTHCFDVRFYKPNKSQVAKRLLEVCQKEGIKSDQTSLELLTEQVNLDIRQSLNLLQMYSKRSKEISYKLLLNGISSFKKDDQVSMSPFEAAKILTTKVDFDRMDLQKKMDLFFLDYELVPMLIHENYLGAVQTQKFNQASVDELESLVDATSAMAEGDILGDCIRSGGNWSLLQNQGFLSSVYVPDKVCGRNTNYPQMSQMLGKMSSQRKINRLIKELRMKLSSSISGNRQAVQFDYVQPLIELIMHNLEQHGKDGVENVIDIMETYNITPEILKEHLMQILFKSNIEDRLKAIPIQVKTQLTKSYNKRFKDDVKVEKKAKKDVDEQQQQHKYDDVLGEMDEIDIIEEDDDIQNEEEDNSEESALKKSIAASTKSLTYPTTKAQQTKAKPQTTKNNLKSTTSTGQQSKIGYPTKNKK